MPDTLVDIIRSRAIPELSSVAPHHVVPLLLFESPDGSREQPGRHEV